MQSGYKGKMADQRYPLVRAMLGNHLLGVEVHPPLLLRWQECIDGCHPNRGFDWAKGARQLGQLPGASVHEQSSVPCGRPTDVVMVIVPQGRGQTAAMMAFYLCHHGCPEDADTHVPYHSIWQRSK